MDYTFDSFRQLLTYAIISLLALPTISFLVKEYFTFSRNYQNAECWLMLYDYLRAELIDMCAKISIAKKNAELIYHHIAYLEKAKELFSNINYKEVTKNFIINTITAGVSYIVGAIILSYALDIPTALLGVMIVITASVLVYNGYEDLEELHHKAVKILGFLNSVTEFLGKSPQVCEKQS